MEENNKKNNKGLQLVIAIGIIILIVVVAIDVVLNYVPLKDIFSKTVNYTTSKEVTVTDKGIADAVDKLYNATVIVEVGNKGKLTGWGSGFVYKVEGDYAYIFTNHHVVDDASEIVIVFSNETEVDGTLVGSDEYADVAVVKVPKDKILAVAEIGSSNDIKVGDTIFAIGTPVSLEYSFTVTRGILSGKDRMVEISSTQNSNSFFQSSYVDTWYMKLLQIDASINSGNSGGPLANSNGEVIGITNSKLSSSYSSTSIENMGFAIPIEDALSVAEKLIEKGKIERPVLGVSMTTIENASKSDIKIDEDIEYGAVVVEVQSGSNASKAGLKSGDIITKIDDNKVKDYMYLKYYLYRYSVGDKVTLTYIRDGKEKTVDVTLKG